MQSILRDAIQDHFPIVLSLYGLRGIGKTTLTRKAIHSLEKSKTKIGQPINMQYINCEEKDSSQVVFSMINGLSQSLNYDLEPNSILNATLGNQINLLTHLISKLSKGKETIHPSKLEESLLFFLDAIECVQPQVINKLMDLCVSQSCFMVTSFNVLKSSPYLSEFKQPEVQIQLNAYTPNNLEKICKNRCAAAFKHPVNNTMIRYVTDLVNKFDYSVPESCLRVLRELYPLIDGNSNVDPGKIQDACRYQFKKYSIDEISIAEFISETNIVDRLALDEIGSFFNSQTRFYITYSELVELYKVACENLEYDYKKRNQSKFLKGLQRVGLLQSSSFTEQSHLHPQQPLSIYSYENVNHKYFLTISPQMLNEILDVAFGLIAFD
jgi:Cdc6-like AAA superfamily ATPase